MVEDWLLRIRSQEFAFCNGLGFRVCGRASVLRVWAA